MSSHETVPHISSTLRWMRFNAVGIAGFALQLGLLKVFVSVLRLEPVTASTLAVEVVIIHNFLWHERFTWRDRNGRNRFARWLRFNGSNGAVSLAGNAGLMWLLVDELGINFLMANAIAVLCCSLVNFVLADRWVFAASHGRKAQCFGD